MIHPDRMESLLGAISEQVTDVAREAHVKGAENPFAGKQIAREMSVLPPSRRGGSELELERASNIVTKNIADGIEKGRVSSEKILLDICGIIFARNS